MIRTANTDTTFARLVRKSFYFVIFETRRSENDCFVVEKHISMCLKGWPGGVGICKWPFRDSQWWAASLFSGVEQFLWPSQLWSPRLKEMPDKRRYTVSTWSLSFAFWENLEACWCLTWYYVTKRKNIRSKTELTCQVALRHGHSSSSQWAAN